MAGVPMPPSSPGDPNSADAYLDAARSSAAQSLKGQAPPSLLEPLQQSAASMGPVGHVHGGAGPAPAAAAPTPLPDAPADDAVPSLPETPAPDAQPAPKPVEQPKLWDSVKQSAGQMGEEVKNGLMRGSLWAANGLGFMAAAGASAIDPYTNPQDTQDKIFDFLKNHVDTAFDYWKTDPNNTNPYAQTVGGVAETMPMLAAGPAAGVVPLVTSAAAEAGKKSIDAGEDEKTAALLALVAGGSSAALQKIPLKSPNIAKRIASAVGFGVPISTATEHMTKTILNDRGYQDAAAQIDPEDPQSLAQSSLLQIIFGIIGGPGKSELPANPAKDATPAAPPGVPPMVPGEPGKEPPPPMPPAPAKDATPASGIVPAATQAPKPALIPDKPTPEPAQDLKAQWKDMNDSKTPRMGVFVTTGTDTSGVDKSLTLAKNQGRTVDLPTGTLVLKTKAEQLKAANDLKNGTDPQVVIGRVTGAGDGKTPADTVAVQGQTPAGAVAVEGAVTPAEVPAKVAEIAAQGHTPVVTTPEAALQRRADLIEGQNTPGVAPSPQGPINKGDRGIVDTGAGARAVRVDDAPVDGKVLVHELDDAGQPSGVVVRVPVDSFKGDGKRAVAPEEKTPTESKSQGEAPAPPSDTETPARSDAEPPSAAAATPAAAAPSERGADRRQLDVPGFSEERRATVRRKLAERTRPVTDADMRLDTPGAPAPTAEQQAKIAAREALQKQDAAIGQKASEPGTQLEQARDLFKMQEVPPPGRKWPANLKERTANVAAFARAVEVEGARAEDSNAVAVAKRASRLDQKSDEAIAKNQGVGHGALDTHAKNLLEAADSLIKGEPVKEPVKAASVGAEKFKAQLEKKRAAADKVEPVKAKPVEKVKAIADVQDETKPKVLSKSDNLKIKNAVDKFAKAKPEDAESKRTEVQKLLDDIMGTHSVNDGNKEAIMAFAEGHRRDTQAPPGRKSRDEEIDDEFSDHRYEKAARADEDMGMIQRGEHGIGPEIKDLHAKLLGDNDLYSVLSKHVDGDQGMRSHAILAHMVSHLSEGPLKNVIIKIAKYAPDSMVRPVSSVEMNGTKSERFAGVYTPSSDRIQLKMHDITDPRTTQTLLHEIVHSATTHFVAQNPDHPFTREIQHLRTVAEGRAKTMYGEKYVTDSLNFMRGSAGEMHPGADTLYGLTNHKEFMSEAISNPEFQRFLTDSEDFAGKNEGLLGGVNKLATHIKNAIAKLFGTTNPREVKLLHSVLNTTDDIMERQHASMMRDELPYIASDARVREDMASIIRLKGNAAPLPNEPRIRAEAGSRATDTARDFIRSSGVPRALRRLVLSNETEAQMYRTNAHWFGSPHDDSNPVRQLNEVNAERASIQNRMVEKALDVVQQRKQLDRGEDKKLGQLQVDATIWGIDPSKEKPALGEAEKENPKDVQRWADFQNRWKNLSPEAQNVFKAERDYNQWAEQQRRIKAIDVALDAYSRTEVPNAQRRLLYSVDSLDQFDGLIGKGKLVDVGESNTALLGALKDTAGIRPTHGPYFHLGRTGDLVVHAVPEGTKQFPSESAARVFASTIEGLGPNSKAKVAEVGGKWQVDYKATYTSMHTDPVEAQKDVDRLKAAGIDVGQVTQKVLSESTAALSVGAKNLVAEATRRIERRGGGADTEALTKALHTSFVQMLAARSSYAASKLARRGVAGVKPEEMGRNFAAHAQSVAWNTGHLATVFKAGEALGKVREAAKNPEADVPQRTVYKRGQFMDEVGKRMQQDFAQNGPSGGLNRVLAKLGFLNFLASPSHAAIWMTQNFTTGIPVAGARWGYGKALAAFGRGMKTVAGPAFRAAVQAHIPMNSFSAHEMTKSVINAVKADPYFSKYAQGENSHIKQLMDRGAMTTAFANELANMAHSTGTGLAARGSDRVFDYARLLPHMADLFNRISTGLAGLEMTGGDIAKTSDFIKETHMDYSQADKSRVFKAIGKVPGFNSVTMFRTYTQGMAHLLYSNIKNMAYAESKSRGEAAKTVAGLMLGTAMFAGVTKAAVLEPIRLAMYAWNKMFGDDDEYHDIDNSIRRFVHEATGSSAATETITGGLPRLLGFDLSSRMGLSDLFLHDPPDLLAGNKDTWMKFAGSMTGPMGQMVADRWTAARKEWMAGNHAGAAMALVPVKALGDAQKAFQLYSGGKVNTAGGQMTQPSAVDALVQASGFKPASVARVQERQEDAYNYKEFAQTRKADLLAAWAATSDKSGLMSKIQAFNKANPGDAISYADFLRQARSAQKGSAIANGQPSRDPGVNRVLNY